MGAIQSRLQTTSPLGVEGPPKTACTFNIRKLTASASSVVCSKNSLSTSSVHPTTDREEMSHFRFLDLPPELRNMVYTELVVVGKVFYTPDDYDIFNGLRYHDYELFRTPNLSLLQVCKQLRSEVEPLYLSQNLFVLPIEWQQCYPFPNHEKSINLVLRPLFSDAAFEHVRNVSVAVDQRLAPFIPHNHVAWNDNSSLTPGSSPSFADQTPGERYDLLHEFHLDVVHKVWAEMLLSLYIFHNAQLSVEIDCSNAYCGIGDCRPIGSAMTCWITEVAPKRIDVLGLQTMEEKMDFVHWAWADGVRHGELRGRYGVRFGKAGQKGRWDEWKVSSQTRVGNRK